MAAPPLLALDAFAVIILGGTGLLVFMLLLIGFFYPGSGAAQVDWKPQQGYEQRVMNEIEDLDQMLEATNSRRRKRGEPELTEHALHQRVREDMTDADKRRESYLAEQDIEQLLEAKNARRARKNLPPVTLEEFKAGLSGTTRTRPEPPAATG